MRGIYNNADCKSLKAREEYAYDILMDNTASRMHTDRPKTPGCMWDDG